MGNVGVVVLVAYFVIVCGGDVIVWWFSLVFCDDVLESFVAPPRQPPNDFFCTQSQSSKTRHGRPLCTSLLGV